MVVASFNRSVMGQSDRHGYWINAGARMIFDEDLEGVSPDVIHEKLNLGSFLPRYKPPKSWRGKRVLIAKSGAFGDQLILSPVLHYLQSLGASPFVACSQHEDYLSLWMHAFDLPLVFPIALDAVWRQNGRGFFDVVVFIPRIWETKRNPGDPNCYDAMYDFLGLVSVSEQFKKPDYRITEHDIATRTEWIKGIEQEDSVELTSGYTLLQPLSVDPNRSMPLATIKTVLETAKGPILVGHNQPFDEEVQALISATQNAINIAGLTPSFEAFASVVAGSKLVLTPDSASLHLAAAFNLRCISFWGPGVDPKTRARYYPENTSVRFDVTAEDLKALI